MRSVLSDFGVFEGSFDGVEIVHFDVEEGRPFFGSIEDEGHVIAEAGVRLVHDFGVAVMEGDEAKPIAVRHFDAFCEIEAIDPERQDRLDFLANRTGVMRLTIMVVLL